MTKLEYNYADAIHTICLCFFNSTLMLFKAGNETVLHLSHIMVPSASKQCCINLLHMHVCKIHLPTMLTLLCIWAINACISYKHTAGLHSGEGWCMLSLDKQSNPVVNDHKWLIELLPKLQASNKPTIVCHCFNLLIKFWGRKAMYP